MTPADFEAWSRDDHPELHAKYQAWRVEKGLGVDPETYRGEFSLSCFMWAHGWLARQHAEWEDAMACQDEPGLGEPGAFR